MTDLRRAGGVAHHLLQVRSSPAGNARPAGVDPSECRAGSAVSFRTHVACTEHGRILSSAPSSSEVAANLSNSTVSRAGAPDRGDDAAACISP